MVTAKSSGYHALMRRAAAVLALWCASCAPDPAEFEEVAWRWTEQTMADAEVPRDQYRIRSSVVLSSSDQEAIVGVSVESAPPRDYILSIIPGDEGWRVRGELARQFESEAYGDATQVEAFRQRLTDLLGQEYLRTFVEMREMPTVFNIEAGEHTPVPRAQWQAYFQTAAHPNPPDTLEPEQRDTAILIVPHDPAQGGGGCYSEVWVYRDFRFVREGQGTIFRGGPRPR